MVVFPISNGFFTLSGSLKLVHIIGSIYGIPQIKLIS
jgi:hypothetical protein